MTGHEPLARCGDVLCVYLGVRVGDHECDPYRPGVDERDAADEAEEME